MPKAKQITLANIEKFGPALLKLPDEATLRAVKVATEFDVFRYLTHEVAALHLELLGRSGFSFLRTHQEAEYIVSESPINDFAPFGVSYRYREPSHSTKLRQIDIDIYGVELAKSAGTEPQILVWCDHAFVFKYPDFSSFYHHMCGVSK